MQIIIVQAEIEAAIRNYINSQLNVKDGHRIDIELSATRGADGFKATIDIVAADAPSLPKEALEAGAAPAPVPTPTPTPSPAKAEVVISKSVASSPAPAPKGDPYAKEELPASDALTAGDAGNGDDASTGTAAAASSEAAAASDTGAAEAKPARSLFAGLKKPVNV